MPVVTEALRAGRDPAEPCKVLLAMLRGAEDKRPVVRAMIGGLRRLWSTSLLMEIAAQARAGHDFSALPPELRAAETDYNRAWLKEAIAEISAKRA